MILNLLYILIGFALLIYGANLLVNGSVGLAKRFNLSDLLIGLTVVAFGTSAPELVVNLKAAFNPGTTDIALTNIIGSNMINTYVILGLAALIFPIASQKSSRRLDIPLSILGPILILILSVDGAISPFDGAILLLVFTAFLFYNIRNAKKYPEKMDQTSAYIPMKIWRAILLILAGLGGLIAGAELIVPNATKLAQGFGVSQAVIGLTIVALGTSLPELATSAVSAFKKNSDIALGNVIGSNIFNVFFILGSSAVTRELPAYKGMMPDLIFTAIGSLMVIGFIYLNKERTLFRNNGAILLLLYIVYLAWTLNKLP